LRELLATGSIETRVVAPVPWFFSTHPRFGDYAMTARIPKREMLSGIDVSHPRYFLAPKVGMTMAPLAMALGALPALRRLQREGFDFDLIDAHYFYPDGVAAALLAKWIGKPYVVTARGSDLNLIAQYRLPRQMMHWAADNARMSIGVSAALTAILRDWGLVPERLSVMRNGVDLQRFAPMNPSDARMHLRLDGDPVLLSVGNLVELKGHDIVIGALPRLLRTHPGAKLVIVGAGHQRDALIALAELLGVRAHVDFVGRQPNQELFRWYSAADLLVLASSREGWPNVLLEAMACGTPVVATRVSGIPEVVAADVAGRLVDRRDADGFAAAIEVLLQDRLDRALVRSYAEKFSWQHTTQAQLALFKSVAFGPGVAIHA